MNLDARARRLAPFAVAAALLAGYLALATSAAATKSNTFDEIAHLTSGYAYWTLNDYRLQPENGNLPQRLAALPAVLEGARFPSLDNPDWRRSDAYAFGRTFFFESGNDIDRLLARGRGVIALLGVLLGILVFTWSRRTHGDVGGLISLTLFTLCPTMLAHGAQATSDMAAALTFTASAGLLWMLSGRVTPLTLLASCAAAAALFLSKFSAPILALIALALGVVKLLSRDALVLSIGRWTRMVSTRTGRLVAFGALGAAHVLVIWIAIWASYGFRYQAFHQPPQAGEQLLVDWTLVLSAPDGTTRSGVGRAIDLAREYRLLPESYLYGFAHTVKFAQSRRAFMDGEHSLTGWASFFPYAFAVKTTLPLLLIVPLGLLATVADRERLKASAPWLVLLAVYWAFAITTNLNIGHRHLLPTYPALFILAGATSLWVTRAFAGPRTLPAAVEQPRAKRKRAARPSEPVRPSLISRIAAATIVLLVAWQAIESFGVRPHYLAYFNQVAGGPGEGYKRLVDSSLDWGQDLPALKAWLDRHAPPGPGRPPVYLSYFGTASPEHAGIEATILESYLPIPSGRPQELRPGYYCVSATMLQGVYLAVNGPWTAKNEETYRMISTLAAARAAAQNEQERARLEAAAGNARPEFWNSAVRLHDELRTARLMAYLRQRPPTANAGYSILIYRLDQAMLDAALTGPAPY